MVGRVVVTGSNYCRGQDRDMESHHSVLFIICNLLFSSVRKDEREDIEEDSTGHDSPLESGLRRVKSVLSVL